MGSQSDSSVYLVFEEEAIFKNMSIIELWMDLELVNYKSYIYIEH
jgi:hypothetical protein